MFITIRLNFSIDISDEYHTMYINSNEIRGICTEDGTTTVYFKRGFSSMSATVDPHTVSQLECDLSFVGRNKGF